DYLYCCLYSLETEVVEILHNLKEKAFKILEKRAQDRNYQDTARLGTWDHAWAKKRRFHAHFLIYLYSLLISLDYFDAEVAKKAVDDIVWKIDVGINKNKFIVTRGYRVFLAAGSDFEGLD
ncbi:hypothetical protein ACJX0J_016169, partial [Zea mays]